MKKTVVAICKHNREIIRIEAPFSPKRYVIKQGKRYIGKVTDGGYRTFTAALERATK